MAKFSKWEVVDIRCCPYISRSGMAVIIKTPEETGMDDMYMMYILDTHYLGYAESCGMCTLPEMVPNNSNGWLYIPENWLRKMPSDY